MRPVAGTNQQCPYCEARRGWKWYPPSIESGSGYYCHACHVYKRTPEFDYKVDGGVAGGDNLIELPAYSNECPEQIKEYLRQYHLTIEDVHKVGGYVPYQHPDRLVFPIYYDTRLVSSETRVFSDGSKKWLTTGSKIYAYEGGGILRKPTCGDSNKTTKDPIFVVEDIISCLNVSKLYGTIALRGTKMSLLTATRLSEIERPIVLWLDGDRAGRAGTEETKKLLRNYNLKVSVMITEKDPKCYTIEQMKNYLQVLNL